MPKIVGSSSIDLTAGIPPENLEALASRIKEAAETGDMTELQAIAAELEAHYGKKQSLSRRILALAVAFDLDGLGELAETMGTPS